MTPLHALSRFECCSIEKLVLHPCHIGERPCPAVFAACFRCRNTFIGLGKCHLRPDFLFASSSRTPPPLIDERPAATVLDRNSPSGGMTFLPSPADLENGQKKAQPLLPPLSVEEGDGSSHAAGAAATDRDRTRGIPTERDRRKAGSLAMSRETVPTGPKPASSPEIHRHDLEDPEEEEREEEGEAKQPQGRRPAQWGQRRRRRSRRQDAQTPPGDCIGCFQHLHPVSSSTTTTAFSFISTSSAAFPFSAGAIVNASIPTSSSSLHHGKATAGTDPPPPLILPPIRCQIQFLTPSLDGFVSVMPPSSSAVHQLAEVAGSCRTPATPRS
ncbi:uncharacterized protein LOC122021464 [Zingiber officinale]|uniref:uncharacterized protein LOC122021464 n=1 Tax=Zingiber officinale TaxID=94328 RepID=UPI001C4BF12F|nr:uncharacterized protein LOC122021464 [Zingiber officinale]